MRVGCLGCFGLIAILTLIGATVAGYAFVSGNVFDVPDVKAPPVSRADGFAAQQKLFEIARQAGRSPRQEPIVLTEREMNSFLAFHLAEPRIPLDPVILRFTRGYFEIQGRTPIRNLVQSTPFAQILPYLPTAKVDTPVWVTVRGTAAVEPVSPGSQRIVARLKLTEFQLGKQALAPALLTFLLGDTASRLTEISVPSSIDSIQIEDGRVIIRTR